MARNSKANAKTATLGLKDSVLPMSYTDLDYFVKTMYSHDTNSGSPITGINVFYLSGICSAEKGGQASAILSTFSINSPSRSVDLRVFPPIQKRWSLR